MKNLITACLVIILCNQLLAQIAPSGHIPAPLPMREVSGLVKDSLDNPVPGVALILVTGQDSLGTVTNQDGIFIFKNVKSATFYLTVRSLGFKTITYHLLKNDALSKLVLDPIILKEEPTFLNEVVVDGTTSVTYKIDTVEYRATDYIVRENATVDELLKKMEGIEVTKSGTVTHQGEVVTKAKLNGKDHMGGNVAVAIQTLPAEIVEKIQIIDDYGDQSARTGVKSGDPQKVLNITTKSDRSIGNIGRIYAGGGSDSRYEGKLGLLRINANQRIVIDGAISNSVNGIAGNDSQSGAEPGSTGGTTMHATPSFNYIDDWGKKVQVNAFYTFQYKDAIVEKSINAQEFNANGTTFVDIDANNVTDTKHHRFNLELDYNINDANFLRITPSVSYTTIADHGKLTNFQEGAVHQDFVSRSSTSTLDPTVGGNILYQHIFKRPRRNFSLNISTSYTDRVTDREQNNVRTFYDGEPQMTEHYEIVNKNLTETYRASATYVEPLTAKTQLEFNTQLNYRGYDNSKVTSEVSESEISVHNPLLSNEFDYSFTEARTALNFRYGTNLTKSNFSIGVNSISTLLEGNDITGSSAIRRRQFYLVPLARFSYAWSRLQKMSVHYTGVPSEPSFNQLQPVRDVSNPQTPVVGNPNLNASFRHSITADYNCYIANLRFNYSIKVNASLITDQIAQNRVLIADSVYGRVYETRFVNLNGTHAVGINHNFQKQFSTKYILALNGTVSYNNTAAMSNSVAYGAKIWRLNERFGPKLYPTRWLELDLNLSYDYTTSTYTLPGLTEIAIHTVAFNANGEIDFLKTFTFGFDASKNYRRGIGANVALNPFVMDFYLEKRLFKRKDCMLRFQAFDLLNQNNFINRNFTDTGFIDVKTNAMSRYFMIGFRASLQKWNGTPSQNGKPLQRRGDGSFKNY